MSNQRSREGRRGQEPEEADAPEESRDGRGGQIQVIARAAAILRALAGQPRGLSLGQIAKRVGLPRSTVQRIVGALEAEQLVTTGGASEGVRLGPMLGLLAASSQTDLVSIAQPHLEALSRRVHETVDLSVMKGHQVVSVAQSRGDQELNVVFPVGGALPTYCTAHGKALLAELSDEEVAQLVGSRLEPFTPKTHRTLPALLADLREVRRSGFAYGLEEHAEGICALGVALRTAAGAQYAIAIPVPAYRFHARLDVLRRELARCRDEIEAAAGATLGPAPDRGAGRR